MKETICTVTGVLGSALAYFLGGWDEALICLCILMIVDMLTGIIVAFVFHNSPKNKNGKIESNQFIKGVFRKLGMLLLIGVAKILDNILGVNFVRTAVEISFIINEIISITENTGLMGIPLPKIITKGLELLSKKGDELNDSK